MLIQKPFYFWIQRLLYRSSNVILMFLLLLLPFQKRFCTTASKFSKQTTPANLIIPDFFLGDLVVFLFVLSLLLQAPKVFGRKLLTKPVQWLVLYCIMAFFSIAFSGHCFLQYIRLLQFSMMIFLFCAIEYIVVHNRIRELAKGLAWTIVFTTGVQCIIACIQYFSQTSLEWHKIGENFCFSNPEKQRWIFDQISHFQLSSNLLYPATGLFSHPNLFGGFLFFSLLNASYLYVIHQKKWIKWSLMPIIFMHFFTLSISFCGTAIIACVISIVAWMLIQYFWMKDISHRKEIKKVGFIFFLSGVVCLALFYQQFFNQMMHYAKDERGTYQVFFQMIKANPWLGIGFDQFCTNPAQSGKTYSIYLLIAVETGIMGFVFFSAFLFCILKKAVTKLFLQEQALFLSIVIGFLWIGCCDCYFVEQMYGKYLFFIPLALFNASIQKANVLLPGHSLQRKIFLPRS